MHSSVIHETAQIDSSAIIHPGCHIGENVVIGPECEIGPNAIVVRDTVMGARNRIHPFATIGGDSQHKAYAGQPTQLIIGDDNVIRESVTINRGDPVGGHVTRVGSRNLFMTCSHVGHDAIVGNDVVLVNHAALAGHVQIEDYVVVGAYAAVAQYCCVGKHAFLTLSTGVTKDVLPFTNIAYLPATVRGINLVGLKRRGFSREDILAIKKAYHEVFGNRDAAILAELKSTSKAACEMIEFYERSERGVVIPRKTLPVEV
ncbi:MAG: acyl-ACP--UDP-N-acetylglucosamine O-acyltransferase [Gammaproteobacteria bacterium]|nr:acyl-ACP--UDP-N-acetylglucosamine O-acyltransferase [Gammaproteobacteria bacterium]